MSDFLPFLSALTGGFMRGNQILQNRKINEAKLKREEARDLALAQDRAADRELRGKQYDLSLKQFAETLRSNQESSARNRATDFKADVTAAFDPVRKFNDDLVNKKFANREEALLAKRRVQGDVYTNLLGLQNRYGLNNLSQFFDNQTFPAYIMSRATGFGDFLPTNFNMMGGPDYKPEYSPESQFDYNANKPITAADRISFNGAVEKAIKRIAAYPPGPAQQTVIDVERGNIKPLADQLGIPLPEVFQPRNFLVPPMPSPVAPTIGPENPAGMVEQARLRELSRSVPLSPEYKAKAGIPETAEPTVVTRFPSMPQDPMVASLIETRKASTRRANQLVEQAEKLFPVRYNQAKYRALLTKASFEIFGDMKQAEIELKKALKTQAFANAASIGPKTAAFVETANANVVSAFERIVSNYEKFITSTNQTIKDLGIDLTNNQLAINNNNLVPLAYALMKDPSQRTTQEKQLITANQLVINSNKPIIEKIQRMRRLEAVRNEASRARKQIELMRNTQMGYRFGSNFGATFPTPEGLSEDPNAESEWDALYGDTSVPSWDALIRGLSAPPSFPSGGADTDSLEYGLPRSRPFGSRSSIGSSSQKF